MSVLRFDPFRDVDRLSEQLLGVPAGSRRAPRFMPMDLFKSGDHYVLLAERSGRSDDAVEWIASERFAGSYMRQLSLGEGINAADIAATYENGVLSVTIPLAEKAKPRKIDVATTAAQQAIAGKVEQSA